MNEDNIGLQKAIHYLLHENAFIGSLLQQINIRVDKRVPTAALKYDKDDSKFEILIGEEYFKTLTHEERMGVFFHEILHFTHGHLFRFEQLGSEKEQMLKNIAADMSINQYIKVLPKGCMNHTEWKDKKGNPFPDFQPFEVYFDLLKETTHPPEQGDGDEQQGQEEKTAKGEQNAKDQVGPQANWDQYKNYKPFDEHDWEQLSEDEKQRLLQEAKKVVKRATDTAFKDYSDIPGSVKELLEKINSMMKKLDYKALLKYAIKKTMTTQDRKGTWYRPNKRYGSYAPGTTNEKAPFINVYIDTSGSITLQELNDFLEVTDGFLKHSAKQCQMGLWHTEMYSMKKYKLGTVLDKSEIEAGGTDPTCVFEHIEKTKPNLSIILTDGHFGKTKINLTQRTIFVISSAGTMDHPYKNYGISVKLEGLK